MARPRLRVRALLAVVALVAVVFGGLKLRQRSDLLSRQAAYQAEREREWTRRRDQYRNVLAGMNGDGQARNFYFRSVPYDGPEHWEAAIAEIIAYHARARRAFERASGRPWEAVVIASPPQALTNHVEVEAKAAEIIESNRAARS